MKTWVTDLIGAIIGAAVPILFTIIYQHIKLKEDTRVEPSIAIYNKERDKKRIKNFLKQNKIRWFYKSNESNDVKYFIKIFNSYKHKMLKCNVEIIIPKRNITLKYAISTLENTNEIIILLQVPLKDGEKFIINCEYETEKRDGLKFVSYNKLEDERFSRIERIYKRKKDFNKQKKQTITENERLTDCKLLTEYSFEDLDCYNADDVAHFIKFDEEVKDGDNNIE